MWINCLAVGLGGFAGAVCRYLVGLLPGYYYLDFPVGTMLINVIGAFFIGLIAGVVPYDMLSVRSQLCLKTGFCGGLTTFSTFSLETVTLLEHEHWLLAGCYVIGSVVVCLLGVFLGKLLAVKVFV